MRIVSSFLIILMLASACKKSSNEIAGDTPACIKEKIKIAAAEEYGYSAVDEYEFKGQLVYVFEPSSNIADASSPVYSADCVQLCSIGGFGGPDILNCQGVKFIGVAVKKRNIWKR